GGSATFLDAAGNAIPLFAPEQLVVGKDAASGALYVDVAFGSSGQLDTASLDGGEIVIAGATVAAAPQSQGGGVYRYTLSGLASGQTATVSFDAGAWTYAGAGAAVTADRTLDANGDTYIDLAYSRIGSAALDPASFTAGAITLGGAGSGVALLAD